MRVKNLFDSDRVEEVKQRITSLQPDCTRQWGNMTPAQTLAHCADGLQMAMGVINPKRAPFPATLLGPLLKPFVFNDDKPMRRNSPSSPELFHPNSATCDFERERARLLAAIDSFATKKADGCTQHPHPFFGRLTPQQWAVLMYKHLDHHLRQFNA